MVIAVLCVDNQVEWVGNPDLAFDFKICATIRNVTDQAVDSRTAEQDCSGFHDVLTLVSLVVHHNRANVGVQIPSKIDCRRYDRGFPIKPSRTFHTRN
jgi:hypothetical protein